MPDVTVTGAELKERYRNERKVELFMENHRYHDLRRWDIATIQLDNKPIRGLKVLKKDDGTKTYEVFNLVNFVFPTKYRFLPVPLSEIEKSKNVLTQNTGY